MRYCRDEMDEKIANSTSTVYSPVTLSSSQIVKYFESELKESKGRSLRVSNMQNSF